MIGLAISLVIQGTILMIRLTFVCVRLLILGVVLLANWISREIDSRA
jgi:hypothetical protein